MTQRLTQKFINPMVPLEAHAVFSGCVTPLPGCPDVAVSHAVYRHENSEDGYGRRANAMRLRQLKELGYSVVICTVDRANKRQIAILRGEGWQCVQSFHNKRTNNVVDIWFKYLS